MIRNAPHDALRRACSKGEPVVEVPTQAVKTSQLQKNFICPIWAVWFGKSVNVYFTRHHLDQFTRALSLNGTPFAAFDGQGNPA